MGVSLSYPFTLTNGTTADASQVMANFNAIIAALAASAAESGSNSSITALTGLASPITAVGGRTQLYVASGTATGSGSAQANTTLVPANYGRVAGQLIAFLPGFTAAVNMTYAPNGLVAATVKKFSTAGEVNLAGGEIVAGQWALLLDDGTNFMLLNDATNNNIANPVNFPVGAEVSIASAATTDLGTISPNTHFANITGTTTITSFGNSAATSAPVYLVKFAAVLTLTYNASSMILPGAANIITAAGDYALMEFLGSSNWRCVDYFPASGQPAVAVAGSSMATGKIFVSSTATTSGTSVTIAVPSDAQEIELEFYGVTCGSTGQMTLVYQVASTSIVASYNQGVVSQSGSSASASSTSAGTNYTLGISTATASEPQFGTVKIQGVQSGNTKGFNSCMSGFSSGPAFITTQFSIGWNSSNTGLINNIVVTAPGTMSAGLIRMYKIK